MKRSPMKRGKPLKPSRLRGALGGWLRWRYTDGRFASKDDLAARLASDDWKKRTPLRKVGARAKREADALREFRREVFERDRWTCRRCGVFWPKGVGLEAHHLLPRARGGSHDPSNGAALCSSCHMGIHTGTAIDYERWLVRTRPERA